MQPFLPYMPTIFAGAVEVITNVVGDALAATA
jgi:hypothetical protein